MTQWTPIQGLKDYGRVLGRKMGYVAIGWLVVYFISHPFRQEGGAINVLILFSPMIGAIAGLIIGWYMATDCVADSGMSGLPLWVILVLASWLPMWIVEGIMHFIMRSWMFGFGGWMLLMGAMLLSMAAAVWYGSTQD